MITNTSIKIDAKNHLANRWGKAALITFCYSLIQYIMNFIEGHTGNIPILNLAIPIAQFVISIPLSYGLLISFMRLKRGEMVNAFDFLSSGFSFFARAWQVTFSMLGKLIVPVILSIISIILFFTGIVSSSDGILRQSASAKSSSTFYETLEKAQFDLIDAQFNYNQDPTPNNYDTLQRAQETVDSIKENADIDNPTTANTTSSSSNSKHLILGAISLLASSIYFYAKHLSYVLSYQIAYDEPSLTAKQVVEKSQILMRGNRGNYFVLTLSFIGWAILCAFTFGIGYFWLIPYMQVSFICFYELLTDISKK